MFTIIETRQNFRLTLHVKRNNQNKIIFKHKKSDSISTETVKSFFKDDIFKHILNVFNISFTTGAFSDKVKLSNDTPIHKKNNSKLECSS